MKLVPIAGETQRFDRRSTPPETTLALLNPVPGGTIAPTLLGGA
jgi:hypothetical protein